MENKIALMTSDTDNVATIFAENVFDGDTVDIRDKRGLSTPVTVIGAVPYGHKIAVKDIACGEHIIKYGESIGIASKNILRGEYVHIHNLDSARGRGDL